jgi:hypothetical protein
VRQVALWSVESLRNSAVFRSWLSCDLLRKSPAAYFTNLGIGYSAGAALILPVRHPEATKVHRVEIGRTGGADLGCQPDISVIRRIIWRII